MAYSAGAVVVVVVIIAVLVGIKISGSSTKSRTSTPTSIAESDPTLTRAEAGVTNLPASASSVLDVPIEALTSAAKGASVASLTGGRSVKGQAPLVDAGKPEVLYIGAGFCPYCAAERWALVAALAKFGTFTNLGATASSPTDSNPSTPTFSFYQSTYSSPYLDFTSIELTARDSSEALESPTPAELTIWKALDPGGSIPFIDFGNRDVLSGATYDSTSMSNQSFDSVAALVGDNRTTVGEGIDRAAGAMVKSICALTGNQPATVCSAT
jgi:thiol-disulfide isomerase/thioredoxin